MKILINTNIFHFFLLPYNVNFFHFTSIPAKTWFTFALFVSVTGMLGIIFNNRNFLTVLLNIELFLIGIGLFFIGISLYTFDFAGQIYALLLFGVAASESAVGLSLFISHFKLRSSITIEDENDRE